MKGMVIPMKFGCCLNMVASGPDGTGIEGIETLAELGYDYAELPLAEVTALPDEAFELLLTRLEKSGVPCEACNNFFPKTMGLTGADADREAALAYAGKALSRARRLGAGIVVFGSGPAKNVPEGFPLDKGYRQVVELLQSIGPMAERERIVIAVEPLRRAECNLINTFAEGCGLARDVNNRNVRVLADFYHMSQEREPVEQVRALGKEWLVHTHLANPQGRVFPADPEEAAYAPFAQALRATGYHGRMSCEAYSNALAVDGKRALAFLRRTFE